MIRAAVLALAIALAAAPAPAQTTDPDPPAPSPPDIMREGARRILDGIRRLVEQMPMFEPPRLTPEGDIILRRIRPVFPEGEKASAPESGHDGVDL
jgi:hypothetical protein